MSIFGLQLLSTDTQKVIPFYSDLFGWDLKAHPMGFHHITFEEDKTPKKRGCTIMPHPMPGLPSSWLAYIEVSDIMSVITKTIPLGGQVIQLPLPSPLGGLFAVICDPAGAVLGVFQKLSD